MSDSIERISPEYLKIQEEMHIGIHQNMQYGSISHIIFPVLKKLINQSKTKSIFDYGCGKQYLRDPIEKMGITYEGYDPAIKKYSNLDISKKYDTVLCIDVMEHVEVEYQHTVMQDIAALSSKFVIFTICPLQAKKVLSDGRNAHVCIAGPSYWLNLICQYFEPIKVASIIEGIPEFFVVCRRNKMEPVFNKMGTIWDGSFKKTEKFHEKYFKEQSRTLYQPDKILKSN